MTQSNTNPATTDEGVHQWTFLSNHSHVLILLDGEPTMRLREVAQQVGITERAVQKIVHDLEEGGYLTRTKDGRRNHYRIHRRKKLRHPVESHCTIADLFKMVKK